MMVNMEILAYNWPTVKNTFGLDNFWWDFILVS